MKPWAVRISRFLTSWSRSAFLQKGQWVHGEKNWKGSISLSHVDGHKRAKIWGIIQGQDRTGCPHTKGNSRSFDNHWREVFCRCQKPKVHHLPCSYVIAACSVSGLDAASYVSQYFTKEAAAQTWCHEIYGIGILGPFTQKKSPSNAHPWSSYEEGHRLTADTSYLERNGRVRGWNEEKHCNLCGVDGHTYKKCPQLSVPTAAAEAGPSGNPTDGSAPPTRIRAHVVVHDTPSNVFVCTKLSILYM